MAEKVTGLSPRQRKALEALIEGKPITDVASVAGVSRKTVYVWLGQSEFRHELDRLSGVILEEVTNRMVALAAQAVETLSKILRTKDVPVVNQIQAANVILRHSTVLWDLYSLNRRVDHIQAILDEAGEL